MVCASRAHSIPQKRCAYLHHVRPLQCTDIVPQSGSLGYQSYKLQCNGIILVFQQQNAEDYYYYQRKNDPVQLNYIKARITIVYVSDAHILRLSVNLN